MIDKKTEEKISGLIKEMTLEEKVSMCHGAGLFRTAGVERLGIPPLITSDGPCGVRPEFHDGHWEEMGLSYSNVSYLPANTALAATWNPERAFESGKTLGCEARGRGKDMILAPGINIMRSPLCGRNYEYMGEDPYLTASMAAPFVRGVQSQGVSACVKHFALNNQETLRNSVNIEADERALREIYLPGFKAAVRRGGAFAVMGAYNKFRGEHCCHNSYLLQKVLRDEWKFDGVVVSDWGGVHDTVEAANNGLDIEMDTSTDFKNYYFADKLVESVKTGEVAETVIDEKVRNILRLLYKVGAFSKERPSGGFNLPQNREQAFKTALESIVLLKNDRNILPLNPKELKNVLVVGKGADWFNAPSMREGDSGDMDALYEITPLTGIMMRLGGNTHVEYEKGFSADQTENAKLFEQAVQKARGMQAVIFVGGLDRSFDCEGKDRDSIDLPYGQDKLIAALLSVNPNTVVVITSGSPVGMSGFIGSAHAVLQNWYSGMEGGYALAQVLFGDVSPSGKLPFTIPVKTEDCPDLMLGEKPDEDTVRYCEGVFVGYRYYDTYEAEPMFCFGHGLSYTTFGYSDMAAFVEYVNDDFTVNISASIENSGDAAGAEVAQLYIAPKSSKVKRPVQELRGFQKVFLGRLQKARVDFKLDKTAFSYYDTAQRQWVCEKGHYELRLCSSSRDIRAVCDVYISNTFCYQE